MKKTLLLAAVAGLGLLACKKENTADVTKPVIQVTTPAADHLDSAPGNSFDLVATLTDDIALSQWKMNIHDADGHTHRITTYAWEWTETGDATGKSFVLTKSIAVPDSAELSTYHLEIEATDKSGNAATPVIIEVHVE